MNTRAKVTVVALLSVFAFASNPAKADVLGFSATLPSLGAVTTEVAKIVAADVRSYLRSALSAPRAARTRTSPTVTIHQVVETTGMETVTVVATRLPAMETVTVVATRLPPLVTETFAQANTRTRL
ncbi:MAG TPA: hypothetical protein VFO35_17280 [Steroidobacteraceae bacterium]|nr:hypothetical protein [Steroidobacteraceae bacterium]